MKVKKQSETGTYKWDEKLGKVLKISDEIPKLNKKSKPDLDLPSCPMSSQCGRCSGG